MLYEEHQPRRGYTKVWPRDYLCPICHRTIIAVGNHRPLYIPSRRGATGEHVVIYVCNSCYIICRSVSWIDSVESAEEHYKCHMELKTHLRTFRK